MIAADFHKRSFQVAQLKLIPPNRKGRGSSVVERIIGNDEVGSSILPRGTSLFVFYPADNCNPKRLCEILRLACNCLLRRLISLAIVLGRGRKLIWISGLYFMYFEILFKLINKIQVNKK